MIVKSYSFEMNGKINEVYTLRNRNGLEAFERKVLRSVANPCATGYFCDRDGVIA